MIRRPSPMQRATGYRRFGRAHAWPSSRRPLAHLGRTRELARRIAARHVRDVPWVASPDMRHRTLRLSTAAVHRPIDRSSFAFKPRINVAFWNVRQGGRIERRPGEPARRFVARVADRHAPPRALSAPPDRHRRAFDAPGALVTRLGQRAVRDERAPRRTIPRVIVQQVSAPSHVESDPRAARRAKRRRSVPDFLEPRDASSRQQTLAVDSATRVAARRAASEHAESPMDIRRVTDEVLRAIDQRIVAQRERMGRA